MSAADWLSSSQEIVTDVKYNRAKIIILIMHKNVK